VIAFDVPRRAAARGQAIERRTAPRADAAPASAPAIAVTAAQR
jgi:hypothetical protein